MNDFDSMNPPPWRVAGAQARELLRLHRGQFMSLNPGREDETVDANTGVAPPLAARLSTEDLPSDIRALILRYEEAHQGERLTPVHFAVTGGSENSVTAGPADLPDEDFLVVLVITDTAVDVEQAEVRSRVLYARRTSSEDE